MAVLVGLRLAQTNVESVEPVHSDISAVQVDELTAPECSGETHQQQSAVTALEYFAGPSGNSLSGDRHHRDDVGNQQWRHLLAWPITGRGVSAPDPGEGGSDGFVIGRADMTATAMSVRDPGDPLGEGGRRECPLPVRCECVGRVDEIRGNSGRVRG